MSAALTIHCEVCGRECAQPSGAQIAESERLYGKLNDPLFCCEGECYQRAQIVFVAKSWLGTPFVDNQGLKGCGVDCAYLLARVMEEAGICGRIEIPHYSPQIYLNRLGDDTYIRMLSAHASEIEERDVKPGDFVLYKQAESYTHGGIIERWPDSIIHPLRPHGVMCSAAWEGFLKFRAHKFFSVFGRELK